MDELLQHPWVTYANDSWQNLDTGALTPMDITLVAGLLVSWLALALALVAIKRIKNQSATSYRLYEKIVHDLHIASSGAIGMGQRIIAMEKRLAKQYVISQPQSPQPHLQAVPNPPLPTQTPVTISSPVAKSAEDLIDNPFDLAKHLLRRGISQEEVSRRCQLSASETALMAMVLNNRDKAANRLAS